MITADSIRLDDLGSVDYTALKALPRSSTRARTIHLFRVYRQPLIP